MMTHLFQQWEHWWFQKVPPHALAITRIGIGCFLLAYAGSYAPYVRSLFSTDAITLPLYISSIPTWMHWLLTAPEPWIAWIIYITLIMSSICITIGHWYRTAILVTLIIGLWAWQLQMHLFPTSYNRILFTCLTVLLFGGADKTFSLHMYLSHGSIFAWKTISIFPQRLITLQITFTFLGVGWQKLWLPKWQSGEILAYSFISRWSTPIGFWIARLPLHIQHYDLFVQGVKLFEFVLPLLFWIPSWRTFAVLSVSIFLFLIATLLSIWWFLFIPPACILFYPPNWVPHMLRQLLKLPIPDQSV